jgi:uncharacterized protein DUF4349
MRLRREQPLDPEIIRDLEAFEAEFAVALHDERLAPRPEFALDLDLRMRDGFASPERTAPLKPRRVTAFRRRWALALGTAASVFIVATALLVSNGGGTDESRVQTAADQSAEGGGVNVPLSKGSASEQQALAPRGPGVRAPSRDVERAASVTLSTPRDEIEEAADEAIRVTERHGGFVMSSNVAAGEQDVGATLDLRIPSERLQRALSDLSELGHVRSRTQETADITAAFRAPRRQLADALAERRALLRQLARATSTNEITAIRARLRATNRRIDRAQRDLRRLRDRVSFSSVAVAIEPGKSNSDGGGWTIGDAFDDALGVLKALLGAALVGLAVLIPFGILAGIAWLVRRSWIRQRRERALEM